MWTVDLPMNPISFHNHHRVERVPGKMVKRVGLTDEARAWLFEATLRMKSQGHGGDFGLNDKLCLSMILNYPSYRFDLDTAIIFDAIQKANVIPNDRHIRELHVIIEDDKQSRMRLQLDAVGKLPWKPKIKGWE